MLRNCVDFVEYALLAIGCEEKCSPGNVSAARVLAYAWGLTAVIVTCIMVLTAVAVDHIVIVELIAGTLTALGLRRRSK